MPLKGNDIANQIDDYAGVGHLSRLWLPAGVAPNDSRRWSPSHLGDCLRLARRLECCPKSNTEESQDVGVWIESWIDNQLDVWRDGTSRLLRCRPRPVLKVVCMRAAFSQVESRRNHGPVRFERSKWWRDRVYPFVSFFADDAQQACRMNRTRPQ